MALALLCSEVYTLTEVLSNRAPYAILGRKQGQLLWSEILLLHPPNNTFINPAKTYNVVLLILSGSEIVISVVWI